MCNILFYRFFTGVALITASVFFSTLIFASEVSRNASDIFERHATAVVKIRIVDRVSDAKAVIGTGFFVDSNGYIVTNYHVISKWVHDPEKYRIEYLDDEKNSHDLEVLNIDVVNDLAVVRAPITTENYLHFSTREMA